MCPPRGGQICTGLPSLSQVVWAYIVTLNPGGGGGGGGVVRHLISPRWLEEM